jgi:hypothetical protein
MTDTYDPMGARSRRHRRRQKVGYAATCAMCGISDPTVLMKTDRAFFEDHHVLGQAHVPHLTITVCRNCHARLSAAQVNDAVPLKRQSTLLERLIAIVLALASLLKALGEELLTWATKGERFTDGLDATFPDWRAYEWAA